MNLDVYLDLCQSLEVATEKLKRYSLPGADQIPAGRKTLHSEIHKLTKLIWNKEKLSHQWKESTVIPIHKMGDKMDCSNYQLL
jgi:hypothetical protein